MRNYILIFVFYFSFQFIHSQVVVEQVPVVANDRNWVSSISYGLNGQTISKSVSYFDVLGKSTQQQSWDILTNRVWASELRYDGFGRTVLQTLSAPINNTSTFGFKPDFILSGGLPISLPQYDSATTLYNPPVISPEVNSLGWYYSDQNNLDTYQDVTTYPYSRTVMSELNQGQVKSVLGGNKINGEWKQSYGFTMAAELPIVANGFYNFYDGRKVLKTVTRDVHSVENVIYSDIDGNTLGAARSGGSTVTAVYSDILDLGYVDIHIPQGVSGGIIIDNYDPVKHNIRVFDLITEQVVATTISQALTLGPGFYRIEDVNNYYEKNNTATTVITPLRVKYSVSYYELTYNDYDLGDKLVKSVQPNGTGQESTLEYNTLGQLLATTSVDEGASRFKYRKDGQIRFSQNSEQAKQQEFSYTNYDNLGRPIESGVYQGTAITFDYYDLDPADAIPPSTLVDDIVDLADGILSDGKREQNFSVYDESDTALLAKLQECSLPSPEYKQCFLESNVSYTYTQNPTTNKTWYSYDIYGRVTWMAQEVQGLSCLKTIHYTYDVFNGNLLLVDYQKHNGSERFTHKYEYNVAGQLTDVYTATDAVAYTKQAHYIYNESGALVRTELAENLQGIDYVYNLNGQLKAINHPSLAATDDPGNDGANGFATDVFGVQLDYYTGDYTRTNTPKAIHTTTQGIDQYNGNIKATRWNTHVPSSTQQAYTFQYNKNNWMTQANFGQATPNAVFTPNANNDYKEGNITYDANGNILSMQRKGYTDGAGTNNMDNFTYVYDTEKKNRLSYVKDTQDNATTTRYSDLKNQEETLVYSTGANGQIKQDNYLYNELGQMTYNVQENVGYHYNASGLVERISTNTTQNSGDFITLDYNDYNDINNNTIETRKWQTPPGFSGVSIRFPFIDLSLDLCSENYPHNSGLELLGTRTVSTKLRVLPNTLNTIDLDVIVDKFLFRRTNGQNASETSDTNDINPTVIVRLKKANGTIIATQTITNQPSEYCSLLFDEHAHFEYTTANEEFVLLEIQTQKTFNGIGSVTSFKQRIFVDNLKVQAAQATKVAFYYNDRGHRVKKASYDNAGNTNTTFYVRDAAGSVMGIYQGFSGPTVRTGPPVLVEHSVFGNDRIGVYKRVATKGGSYTLYEITDHLGNVRAVIRKAGSAIVSLTSKTDYYPFGMPMPNKTTTDNNYRYNFQGQEKDPETGMEAFELRLWDGRLGRWLTVDPYGQYASPYLGMGNNPMNMIDPDGGFAEGGEDPLWLKMYYKYGVGGENKPIGIETVVVTGVANKSYSLNDLKNDYLLYANRAERSVDGWGQSAAQFFANSLPPIAVYNGVGSYTSGNDIYNNKISKTEGTVQAVASFLPFLKVGRVSNLWKVGSYNELRGLEAGLQAHHVGQKSLMARFIPGYNPATAPSILVPAIGHVTNMPGIGRVAATRGLGGFTNARQVLARDIFELRRVYGSQGIPNSSLQQLIQMNKTMYPGAFIK